MYITSIFETRFHGVKSVFELTYVVKDALELLILRPLYSECWAWRNATMSSLTLLESPARSHACRVGTLLTEGLSQP